MPTARPAACPPLTENPMAINIEPYAIPSRKTVEFTAQADPTALILDFHKSEKGNA
jgi:hypothetical protein